jgi:long-chain acyl-CoA synthetase
MTSETLVSVFNNQAGALPDRPLLRVKQDEAYQDVTWAEIQRSALNLAAGLLELGVEASDRVAILSENRQEWIEADFAIMSVGAITVALHAPLTAAQVKEQLADAEPVAVFVSNAEQRDKLLSVRAEIPSIRHVIAFEDSAALPGVASLSSVTATGVTRLNSDLTCVERRSVAVTPDDLAALCYTSGTTGESKGVMLTHDNIVSNIRAFEAYYPADGEKVVLLYLPLSHIYARTCDLYFGVATGRVLALAESIDTLAQNLQEVRPHFISGVPRVHQKLSSAARAMEAAGQTGALRAILGGRIEYVSSGGAALPAEIAQYYEQNGVPVYQGYGLTETSPVISFSYAGKSKPGAAGVPLPGIEVKIAEDGEILTRGPHVMKGYWRKPEATAEVIDGEGWFHTGDIGCLDQEGLLHITDRKKDLIVTSYGKNVAPQMVEGLLSFDPFIEQALVYGDGRPCLTALIVPSVPALEAWAGQNGLGAHTVEALCQMPEVYKLYEERVTCALRDLSTTEQVKKFVLLPEPFSYARGEITLTAKLRRKQILERYQSELDRLYAE